MVSKLSPFCRCPPGMMSHQGAAVRVRHRPAVLLHQFVGDFIARESVADDQGQTVFLREVALIAQRQSCRWCRCWCNSPGPPG